MNTNKPSDAEVRAVHRKRLSWAFPFETWGDYEREHEDAVVQLVQAALKGEVERPWFHSHGDEETGLCTDCDAAAVIQRLEGRDE